MRQGEESATAPEVGKGLFDIHRQCDKNRRMDTLSKLQDIFRNVFDDDSLVITRDTTAEDIEAWDSVQNITLMLEVESAFGIRFSTSEIAYFKHVGDLIDGIARKAKK